MDVGLGASQAESLPSQLDLGSQESRGEEDLFGDSFPHDDLHVSQEFDRLLQEDPRDARHAPDAQPEERSEGRRTDEETAAELPTQSLPSHTSIFTRRGRPDMVLHDALRKAMGNAMEPTTEGGELVEARQDQLQALPAQDELSTSTSDAQSQRRDLVQRASVDFNTRGGLLKRPLRGLCTESPVALATRAATTLARMPDERVDSEVLSVGSVLLGDGPLMLASKRMRAKELGVTVAKMDALTPLMGSTVLLTERAGRSALEKSVAMRMGNSNLLMYIDCASYDETPLPVALTSFHSEVGSHRDDNASAPSSDAPQLVGALAPSGSSGLLVKLSSNQGPQKILSMFETGAMLFTSGDKHCVILSSTLCPLSVLQSGHGVVLQEALLRLNSASLASGWFQQRLRVVCTDRGKPNLFAERHIGEERREGGWGALHQMCETHKTATAHEATFVLVDDHVKGMIHCALSLHSGSAMSVFRACLRAEIGSRFQVLHGSPPQSAIEHKMTIMRVFVSHGASLATRRILLAMCPNGDWRSEFVEFYAPPNSQATRARFLDQVTNGLIAALCMGQPTIYKRSRWTGADRATDYLGILEACHGLLSSTFRRFAAHFQANLAAHCRESRASGALGPDGSEDLEPARAAWPNIEDEPHPVAGDVIALANEAQVPAEQGAGPQDTQPNWAVINATHRRIGDEWLRSKPLGMLIAMRTVMEPLRRLLKRQLVVASEEWELEQRSRVAERRKTGEASFADREYRLTIAALGADEQTFFKQLRAIMDGDEFWQILPDKDHTERFRATVFRLLSRAGCLVFELLEVPHDQFPVRLFRLLAEPSAAAELAEVPDCLLDPCSADFKRLHPGFSGDALLQKLAVIAQVCPKDISQVEAKHATIRRILLSSSMHTHVQRLLDLSASWVFLQFRKRAERLARQRAKAIGQPHKVHGNRGPRKQPDSVKFPCVPEFFPRV